MHEQIILLLGVGSEPDTILKYILIITYITLRGKLKLILLHDSCPESIHKYETLKCVTGVNM